jgi:hypothetical protein
MHVRMLKRGALRSERARVRTRVYLGFQRRFVTLCEGCLGLSLRGVFGLEALRGVFGLEFVRHCEGRSGLSLVFGLEFGVRA